MNAKLELLFSAIEKQRNDLLATLTELPEGVLAKNPAPGKWSALQILTHLYTSERLSIGYVKKKSLGIEQLGNAGLKHSLLFEILRISQHIPIRYKAPKTVLQNTPETMPLPLLIEHWNLLRLELKVMLENLPEKHIHKLVFKHPVAGRLSLPQAVAFFAEHIHHHMPQFQRIIKNR